jgi:hypothetical protein
MKTYNLGNWSTKRVVEISDDNTVTVKKNNGTVIKTFAVSQIAGIAHVKANGLTNGALRFCENYEDSVSASLWAMGTQPDSLVLTMGDDESVQEILGWFESHKDSTTKRSPYDLEAKSKGSFVALEGRTVIIRNTGFVNQLAKGGIQGEKRIPIKSILSVQFKDATDLTAGYIQFETAGGSKNPARGGAFEAAGDENSLLFNVDDAPQFKAIRDRVNQLLSEDSAGQGVVSNADELTKFSKLRDEGIITEEEFLAKKKQLLGL